MSCVFWNESSFKIIQKTITVFRHLFKYGTMSLITWWSEALRRLVMNCNTQISDRKKIQLHNKNYATKITFCTSKKFYPKWIHKIINGFQLVLTCLKLTIETLRVKFNLHVKLKFNTKDTWTTSIDRVIMPSC